MPRAAIAPFVGGVVRIGGPTGIADVPVAGLGPLGGIAAALDHAARQGVDSVLTIGCDMPRLPEGLVEALLRRAPAYCVEAPVLGHWPVSALSGLFDLLHGAAAAGKPPGRAGSHDDRGSKTGPSIKSWASMIGAVPIDSPQPIANVNTPADLRTL